jgi:hypothetical protein
MIMRSSESHNYYVKPAENLYTSQFELHISQEYFLRNSLHFNRDLMTMRLNNYVQSFIDELFFTHMNMASVMGVNRKSAIVSFLETFEFDESDNMNYDMLKKKYYRYRKGRRARVFLCPPTSIR